LWKSVLFADPPLTSIRVEPQLERPPIKDRSNIALALIVGVGLGLRLLAFCNHHSLGIDEARLALSIAARSYSQLFPPLEHDQSAPLLFLWGERLLRDLLGVHDLVLRSLPLAAGAATVVLSYPVFRRFLEVRGAVFATALTAVAPTLVHYSTSVKQYTLETLVTLLLLWLASDLQDKPTRHRSVLLLAAGSVAVWASGPAVFVLAAIGLSLMLTRGSRALPWLLLAAALWGASFALADFLVYRHATANPYMARFWAPAFVTLSDLESLRSFAEALGLFAWGLTMGELPPLRPTLGGTIVAATAVLLIALSAWGLVRIARLRGRSRAVLVAGPIAAALVASAVHAYPVGVRVMVFSAPLLHVLVAGGVAAAASAFGATRRQRAAWLAFAVLLLAYPSFGSLLRVIGYTPATELHSLVRELRWRRQPGEALYVFAGSIPAWTFYSTDWRAPDSPRLARLNRLSQPGGPAFENAPSRGHEVQDPATDLISTSAAGPEILGLPTGMEFLAVRGVMQHQPDPGWAANEAARITSLRSRTAWILMSEYYGPELELFQELEKQGGTCTDALAGSGTRLARFEFQRVSQRDSTGLSHDQQSLGEGCGQLR
jgi:Dolichyl-phosphate-mannose-protein mannosyltransferase